MKYTEVVEEVSKDLNIDLDVVKYAYKSMFEFIREKATQLPFKEKLSEEEFNSLRTNFNIPSIGKLYCTYDRYMGVRKRLEYANKIREEYGENKQCKED